MANLSAKVTIEELPAAPASIEGVSTSTVASCGWTKRGRTDQIIRCASYAEFAQRLGDVWTKSYIPLAMQAFYANEGKVALVRRVTPNDAVVASEVIEDAATAAEFVSRQHVSSIITLDATHFNVTIAVDGGAATTVDVTGDLGVAGSYPVATILANLAAGFPGTTWSLITETHLAGTRYRFKVVSNTTGVTSSLAFSAPAGNSAMERLLGLLAAVLPLTRTGLAAATPRYTFDALGPGAWGNDIRFVLSGNENYRTSTGGYSRFDLEIQEELDGDGKFESREQYLEIVIDDDASPVFIVDYVGDRSSFVAITEGTAFGIPRALQPVTISNEWLGDGIGNGVITNWSGRVSNVPPNRKNVRITTTLINGITDVPVDVTDDGLGSFTGTGITSGSVDYTTGEISLVFAYPVKTNVPVYVSYTYTAVSELTYDLSGGTEGTGPLTRNDVSAPGLAATKGGMYIFNDVIDETLQFILPDFAGSLSVHNDLISWAEGRKDIFIILDPAQGLDRDGVVRYVRDEAAFNTSYAAIYWPWLKVANPLADGAPKAIPPSGHVAGVYARTDATRNVAKAPAGISDGRLNFCLGLERTISEPDRDVVYPSRVNPFIAERITGRCVWGARTLSLDKRWRYIQSRRFFMFCEKSVYINSWWACFETIGPDLWSRLETNVKGFLYGLLQSGYFPSKKEADSYAVICNDTNNLASNADNGEVIVDIFLAVSKAGEFIKFRFRQKLST